MAGSATVGLLRVLLTANSAEFETAMKRAANSAKTWSKDLHSIGTQASTIGASLTRVLTVPILGIGVSAAKFAMDFESSFAGVRKTVQATDAEFAVMEQAFRDLAKTIPVNVNELNRLGEAAGALGIPKAEVVDFARVMALLGVTTNVTADQAAESIAKIQNIFGAAGQDTERFASTLVALGNDGASTEDQILSMATRIAGAGNVIGLTQGEVLGFASALSSVGLEAEAGGTAISRVFVDMASAVSKGGAELDQFAKVAGMSGQQFVQTFKTDAAGAATAFIEGLGRIKTSGGDLIGTLTEMGITEVRLRDTLLRAAGAGDLLRKSLDLQSDAWQNNTALSNEAAERFKTTESQLTLLWGRIKDVGITLGNALLPAIRSAIGAVNVFLPIIDSLAKGFAALPGGLQLTVIGLGLTVVAAVSMLYIFGQLALATSAIIGAFTAKGIATRALTAVMVENTVATTANTAAATANAVAQGGAGVAAAGRLTLALGLLGKASAVAATAFASWKVGTWIGEITGLSDAYGRLWARLYEGLGILPKGTTAQYDTLRAAQEVSAALKVESDGWKALTTATQAQVAVLPSMNELLKISNTLDIERAQAMRGASDATLGGVAALAAVRKEIVGLTKEQRANILASDTMGDSATEIGERYHVSEAAVRLFLEGVQEATKATEKQTEAEKALAASVDRSAIALFKYSTFLPTVTSQYQALMLAGTGIEKTLTAGIPLWYGAAAGTKAVGVEADKTNSSIEYMTSALVDVRIEQLEVNDAWLRAQEAIAGLAGGMTNLFDALAGLTGSNTVQWFGDLADSISQAARANLQLNKDRTAAGGNLAQEAAAWVQWGANVVKAFDQATQSSSRFQNTVGGALAGAQAGSAGGWAGALAGAVVGGILGNQKSINDGLRAQTALLKDQFLIAHGGYLELRADLAAVDAEGKLAHAAMFELVRAHTPEQLDAAIRKVLDLLDVYKLLGPEAEAAGKLLTESFIMAADAGKLPRDVIDEMNKRLDEAMRIGPSAVAAIIPQLAELARQGGLSAEAILALINNLDGLSAHDRAVANIVAGFSGVDVMDQANIMMEAIAQMGGIADLTEAELAQVNGALDAAIQKYEALGQTAPQAMIDLFNATKSTTDATDEATDATTELQRQRQSLMDSIANEAPEETMGSVEQATLDQIAALDEQIAQVEEAAVNQQAAATDTTTAQEDVTGAVEDTTTAIDVLASAGEQRLSDLINRGINPAADALAGVSDMADDMGDHLADSLARGVAGMQELYDWALKVAYGASPGGLRGIRVEARELGLDITGMSEEAIRAMVRLYQETVRVASAVHGADWKGHGADWKGGPLGDSLHGADWKGGSDHLVDGAIPPHGTDATSSGKSGGDCYEFNAYFNEAPKDPRQAKEMAYQMADTFINLIDRDEGGRRSRLVRAARLPGRA